MLFRTRPITYGRIHRKHRVHQTRIPTVKYLQFSNLTAKLSSLTPQSYLGPRYVFLYVRKYTVSVLRVHFGSFLKPIPLNHKAQTGSRFLVWRFRFDLGRLASDCREPLHQSDHVGGRLARSRPQETAEHHACCINPTAGTVNQAVSFFIYKT